MQLLTQHTAMADEIGTGKHHVKALRQCRSRLHRAYSSQKLSGGVGYDDTGALVAFFRGGQNERSERADDRFGIRGRVHEIEELFCRDSTPSVYQLGEVSRRSPAIVVPNASSQPPQSQIEPTAFVGEKVFFAGRSGYQFLSWVNGAEARARSAVDDRAVSEPPIVNKQRRNVIDDP